jgi:hypothetical protein
MLQPNEDDEIIAELRRFREEYWARFGNNVELILEDRRRCAKDFPGKRVSLKKEARERFERQQREAAK